MPHQAQACDICTILFPPLSKWNYIGLCGCYCLAQNIMKAHWAGSAKKLQISIFRISKKFLIHFKIGNIPLGKPPSITK